MSTSHFAVSGPACGTCLAELMEAVRAVRGVTGVGVTLVHGAPSALVVTALEPVPGEEIGAAVAAVGFTFARQGAPAEPARGARRARPAPLI